MEVINVLVVVLAAVGSVLSQQGISDEVSDYDKAVAIVQRSSDLTNEIAQNAVVKIEDIVSSLTLATAEARFSFIHVANFANVNKLSALEETVADDPSDKCANKGTPTIKVITEKTASAMVKCFADKSREAEDIHKDTLALNDQAGDIMPRAVERLNRCSDKSEDVNCLENELKEILRGSATIGHELEQNVIRAEGLLGTLHQDVAQCLGELVAAFITEIGKNGSKMVSCYAKEN